MIARAILLVCLSTFLAVTPTSFASPVHLSPPNDSANNDIEIVTSKNRTIFEYRDNGYLMMIKVVPKHGLPYYMVPANGPPGPQNLDFAKKLYPSWIILQW